MLVYKEKNNLIHKLHPFTIVAFVTVILMMSLIFSNPLYLAVLFVAVGTVIIAAGNLKEWLLYLKFTVLMIVLLMLVNVVFVHEGQTTLLVVPHIPVLGTVSITLEALAYAAGMGIRLLVIISVFCLYTYAVNPDKVLKLFSQWGNRSVIMITLSTRLFPLLVKDYLRIIEVQRCRGVKFAHAGLWQKAKIILPVISVLLLSSLERAMQLAESMYARGYGSGSRTYYTRDLWRPRDYCILIALLLSLITGSMAIWKGWAQYSYYPVLTAINIKEIYIAGLILFFLLLPAILDWGWKKWPLLKSKI